MISPFGHAVKFLDRSPLFGVSIALKKRFMAPRGVFIRHTPQVPATAGFGEFLSATSTPFVADRFSL